MKKIINKIVRLMSASLLILILGFSFDIADADKSGVVKIPTHNWPSQQVGAKVVGELMKMVGEKVEYIPMDPQTVYQSMAEGDVDIVHEIWESAFGASYTNALNGGGIEEILTHDAVPREDWWYPEYVEQVCPGMPDWKALAKCSAKFARTDSDGKGVFFAGPTDWLKHDNEKVEALGMNFIVKNVDLISDLWAELDTAVKEKKPVVIFNWRPNFVVAKYAGKFVEFPKYDPKCTTDPSWGVNPNALYDCGNPTNGWLKLAVNADFKKNHPKAYKVVKQINFSSSDISKMANYVKTDGLEVTVAAQQWLKDHEQKWSNWIK